jgi:hypothetical protein
VFFVAVFAYPCALALLCVGAGLLVDRASGGFLPGLLLPAVGVALLVAVSQLTTISGAIAPATPYVLAATAAAGFWLGRHRLQAWWPAYWQLAVPVIAFLAALAPVILAGRPTFSSYQVLTDSAVHMIGGDYLIRHGHDFGGLDQRNSYGRYLVAYFNTSYPSGADTLFGGTALLVRVPLIWAFQPFNAFVLATTAGPAWVLSRRLGLAGVWAALAALAVTLPALVYAYELIGSIKEITALPMVMTLGALLVVRERWLGTHVAGAIPFALVAACGVSVLGVGFGVWALAPAAVLLVVLVRDVRAGRRSTRAALQFVAVGVAVTLAAAVETWIQVQASVQVAQTIASTNNSGNLSHPLSRLQALGTWLVDSYRHTPTAGRGRVTDLLVAGTALAAGAGLLRLARRREYVVGGWIVLSVIAGFSVTLYGTAWVEAKALVLTSPVLVLAAWGGVSALRASAGRAGLPAALVLAAALVGGVAVSDALQYHSSLLAPTARYQEMASLNGRFAGRGPTLFTDFDEYSLYELRSLDVGGPDFLFPPIALSAIAPGHGSRVDINLISPRALRAYPLILMRRDPAASRPPSAYRLLWQGTYYQLWGRGPAARTAIAHVALSGVGTIRCTQLLRPLARRAIASGARLVAAKRPPVVRVDIAHARHPAWTYHTPLGLRLASPGQLHAKFTIARTGRWQLWLQGETMRVLRVSVDGRQVGVLSDQIGGSHLSTNTMAPLNMSLVAGAHRLTITRAGATLAPGDGTSATLHAVFLTPAGPLGQETLGTIPAARWRSLCGRAYDWVEVVPA